MREAQNFALSPIVALRARKIPNKLETHGMEELVNLLVCLGNLYNKENMKNNKEK